MTTYVVAAGRKFRVYKNRQEIERGELNYPIGKSPMQHSRSADMLALGGELYMRRPMGKPPVVLELLLGGLSR